MRARLILLFAIQLTIWACAPHQEIELREISQFKTKGWSHDTALDGKYLYVADREAGFLRFDTQLGYRDPMRGKPARDVISLAANSGTPLLACNKEGFILVSPSGEIRGSYSNGDIANAAEVRGDLAFGAYGMTGMVVMRVARNTVQLVSRVPSSGWSHDLRLSGNQAFLADWKGLKVIDIRDPEKPLEIAFLPSAAQFISLSIKESAGRRVLAAAEGHAGIALISLDSEGRPSFLGRNYLGLNPKDESHPKSGGWVHSVAWAGRYLFAANWKRGLAVLDVIDPRQPRVVMEYPTSGTSLGVKAAIQSDGSYLVYLADGESGLRVFRFRGQQ